MMSSKVAKFYLLVLFYFLAEPFWVYGQRDIPTNNLSLPVLITLENGTYGSGFFAGDSANIYLVTAKHLLFDLRTHALISKTATVLKYSITDSTEGRFRFALALDELLKTQNLKDHKEQDIAVVYLAKKERQPSGGIGLRFVPGVKVLERSPVSLIGTDFSSFTKLEDVLVANEVIIFGYPRSLGIRELPQFEYDRPLLRKGIVAGINRSTKTIILDCPVYPGNSGGPVLEIDRSSLTTIKFKIIGVVSQFVPFIQKQTSQKKGRSHLTISNSGYSIVTPIEALSEVILGWGRTSPK